MTAPAIRAEGLTKRFGKKQALAGIDLEAATGTVLGVLGPNGAGKTTTVRVLSTLLRPDSGRAWMAGHDVLADPEAVRRDLGLSGQYAAVDEKLTGRENLYLVARLYGFGRHAARRRAGQLLSSFDLEDAADLPSGTYSGGGCAEGWTWPARWWRDRPWSSWTNPRQASTPEAARTPGRRSETWSLKERRCC